MYKQNRHTDTLIAILRTPIGGDVLIFQNFLGGMVTWSPQYATEIIV